jgi:hypothetical protein
MELWQNQKTEGVRMSVEQVRLEAGRFQRKIGARNLREYVAAVAVTAFLGYEFSRAKDLLVRLGFGLVMAATAYVVWHLLTKGSPGEADERAGLSGWIEFRRRELARQRDLLRGIWRWYLGPFIPGFVVITVAFGRSLHGKHWGLLVADTLFYAAVFIVGGKLNAKAAQKLQRQIDELDEQGRK